MLRLLLCSALAAAPVWADGTIAHLADGGGWKTTVQVMNVGNTVVTPTIWFWGENGRSINLPIRWGDSWPGVHPRNGIAPGGIWIFETEGTSPALKLGWATFEDDPYNSLVATTIFTSIGTPGRPSQEASVPLETSTSRKLMFGFDNIAGFQTGIALVNRSSKPADILLTFRAEDGSRIFLDAVSMGAFEHRSWVLTTQWPALAGKQGTMLVTMQDNGDPYRVGLVGLGIRANPSGAFTSFQPASVR